MKRLVFIIVLTFAFVTEVQAESNSDFELIEGAEINVRIDFTALMRTLDKDVDGTQNSPADGRKHAKGFELSISPKDNNWGIRDVKETFGVEFLLMGEPTDQHRSMTSDTSSYFVKLEKKLKPESPIYCFGQIDFNSWKRNSNLEFPNKYWGDLLFSSVVVGLGAEYKSFYLQGGAILPFWTGVDSGPKPEPKVGYSFDLGVKIKKRFKIGTSYEEINFGNGDQNLRVSRTYLGFLF